MSHLGDKEKETKQKTKNHERKKKKVIADKTVRAIQP